MSIDGAVRSEDSKFSEDLLGATTGNVQGIERGVDKESIFRQFDLNGDGELNFFDVSLFLTDFNGGGDYNGDDT